MVQHNSHRPGNQALVREINLSTIITHLYKHAPVSRSALAEITGLNKTTVSSLMQELLSYKFVREIGLSSAGTGRPAMLMALDPAAGFIVSCEIGVDFILVICSNFAAEVIWRQQETIEPGTKQEAIIANVLAFLRQGIAVGRQAYGILLGVAVGVPGLVDQETGALLFAPNLTWQDVPLRTILENDLQLPVFVDNEANMAALGEYYFGAAQDYDEVLYISAGVGLGGGMVRYGQLVRGVAGFAAEFGHMTMDPEGKPCNCGNRGCWETQVSQAALFALIRQAIVEQGQVSALFELDGHHLRKLTMSMVVDAARADDPVALLALTQMGRHLGIGIASLLNALNPKLVVFGGVLSLAGEFLLPAVNAEVQRRALPWNERGARIVLAQHGFEASVMGGVATVYQAVLAQPAHMARQSQRISARLR